MIPDALLTLLEAVIRALLAACILGAVLRLLRVKNVPAQKAAWALVLLAAFAMPLMMRWEWLPCWAAVKLPTPSWTKISDPAASLAVAPAISTPPMYKQETGPELTPVGVDESYEFSPISTTEFPAPQPSIAKRAASPPRAAAPPVINPAPKNLLPSVFAFAWLAYLGVGSALLLRLVFGLTSSIRIWVGAKPVEVLHATNIPPGIPVRASQQIASPVNIGSGIVLPAGYATWDDEKLRVVLAHEHAHIQQHDYYLQLLAGIYAACTWFSPLGWWLKRKLSELGEAISDHAGLEAAVSPSAYAELLLEFAALPRPTISGVAMANSSNLSQRIERLLNEPSFRKTFAGGRRVLVSLVIPAVLIAFASLVRVKAAATPTQPLHHKRHSSQMICRLLLWPSLFTPVTTPLRSRKPASVPRRNLRPRQPRQQHPLPRRLRQRPHLLCPLLPSKSLSPRRCLFRTSMSMTRSRPCRTSISIWVTSDPTRNPMPSSAIPEPRRSSTAIGMA